MGASDASKNHAKLPKANKLQQHYADGPERRCRTLRKTEHEKVADRKKESKVAVARVENVRCSDDVVESASHKREKWRMRMRCLEET